MSLQLTKIKERLKSHNQEHLLSFLPRLNDSQKEMLIREINSLDINLITSLNKQLLQKNGANLCKEKIEPMKAPTIQSFSESEKKDLTLLGYNALQEGKVAAFLVAGGQGTRLGHNGPKGTLDIALPSKKSLFELQAQRLLALSKKINRIIPWYIMTSPLNHCQTVSFFKSNNYFGLPNCSLYKGFQLAQAFIVSLNIDSISECSVGVNYGRV